MFLDKTSYSKRQTFFNLIQKIKNNFSSTLPQPSLTTRKESKTNHNSPSTAPAVLIKLAACCCYFPSSISSPSTTHLHQVRRLKTRYYLFMNSSQRLLEPKAHDAFGAIKFLFSSYHRTEPRNGLLLLCRGHIWLLGLTLLLRLLRIIRE